MRTSFTKGLSSRGRGEARSCFLGFMPVTSPKMREKSLANGFDPASAAALLFAAITVP